MFLSIGEPSYRISDLVHEDSLDELKRKLSIAVIDDNPFPRAEALRNHGFRIDELGGDIRSISQLAEYPVVVCDIRGVGVAFGSEYEGAHVIAETRRSYPDKYLIAFTGQTYSIKYNSLLASADECLEKDVSTDVWNKSLASALEAVGSSKSRWIRFRTHLSEQGVEAYTIFRMEQAFIKAAKARDPDLMKMDKSVRELPSYLKPIAIAFAETAIKVALSHIGGG